MKFYFKSFTALLLVLLVCLMQSNFVLAVKNVNVKSVKLNKNAISLEKGKSFTLNASLNPKNASNKQVSWKSSNLAIAKVSSKGVVTAIKVGKATITVTTKNGNNTAKCVVNVTDPIANKAQKVKNIGDFSFLYYAKDERYRLFFSLTDKNGKRISSTADVAIRIINENGEEVYSDLKTISSKDFSFWPSANEKPKLLCKIDIDNTSVFDSMSENGTVHVTVSYKNIFKFSDNSFAVKNLPLTPLTELYTLEDIVFPFDKYIYSSGIDDDSETYVEITDGSYEFVKNKDDTVDLHLYFSGLVDGASEILFTINEYNSPAYSGVLKINGETIVPNLPPGKYTFSL